MSRSTTAMAARYQHVTDPIRRDVARRGGGLNWSDEDAAEAWSRLELRPETKRRVGLDEPVPAFPLVSVAEDRVSWFRT